MKILYGTSNTGKISVMQNCLLGLDIDLISLKDMNGKIPSVIETGNTPLENAIQKAQTYYHEFKMPVFSCDSGLYFDNLPSLSPKVNVRNIDGKRMSDSQMIDYYSDIAFKYGDIIAQYQNAICFIIDENHIYTDESEDLFGKKFIITSVPHEKRIDGFPLDSLSKNIDGSGYFYDNKEIVKDDLSGFRRFFINVLN